MVFDNISVLLACIKWKEKTIKLSRPFGGFADLAIAGSNDDCIASGDSLQLKLFIEKISINIYPFCISV